MAETLSQQALGWAARDTSGVFSPFHFSRRANGAEDVSIKILFCGICHTDLHYAKNDFGMTTYPIVPGHEITGVVTDVGSNIGNLFKVGDRVGVGCMVGSCNAPTCDACKEGLESYCPNIILTYNSVYHDGTPTYGGYSNIIVVNYKYVVHFPEKLALDAGAPLLCAGITIYSPMKYYGMTEAAQGKHLGVVGLGGLGHVAVKFGKALGMRVTIISTSAHKEREAKELLGADEFLVSKDHQQMQVSQFALVLGKNDQGIIKSLCLAAAKTKNDDKSKFNSSQLHISEVPVTSQFISKGYVNSFSTQPLQEVAC